jgi:hypothetical protein
MTEEERYHLKEERVKQSNSFINKEQENGCSSLISAVVFLLQPTVRLPLGNVISSQVSFFFRVSISSIIAFFH